MASHVISRAEMPKPARRAAAVGATLLTGALLGGIAGTAQPSDLVLSQQISGRALQLVAQSIVFIDGHDYPNGSTRMADELQRQYQYQPCVAPCTHLAAPAPGTVFDFINDTSVYPGTYGPVDGPLAPSGEESVNEGQAAIDQQVRQELAAGNTPVTVVGYSEGAVAASHEVPVWPQGGPVRFVLIGNPERPNGGVLARMPAGTDVPVIGLVGGNATSSTGGPVVMVTRQYDGIADAPAYPVNLLADANAMLGFYYLHGDYYSVDPNAPGNIVTTSENGNMTDILVPAPPGELPLFMPLAQAGVPQPILVALDPATRAIIETGYDRTSDPSEQVRFGLVPPVSAWPADGQAVADGAANTAGALPGAVVASSPVPAPVSQISSTPPAAPAVPTHSTQPALVTMASGNKVSPRSLDTAPSSPSSMTGGLNPAVSSVTSAVTAAATKLAKSMSTGVGNPTP